MFIYLKIQKNYENLFLKLRKKNQASPKEEAKYVKWKQNVQK